MKLRRARQGANGLVQIRADEGWVSLAQALASLSPRPSGPDGAQWSSNIVAFLAAPPEIHEQVQRVAGSLSPDETPAGSVLIPFEPRSYRDFLLFERHAVDAARGFVRTFWPRLMPITHAYERLTGRTFPAFRPKPLWYRQPLYYMGNHLAFAVDGEDVAIPSYTRALDFELEIGFVLARELLDASPAEAEAAIGGFVVLNDFSARDVQYEEMQSGFGPQKAKHFANAISSVVVTADEILPRWRALKGFVRINGELVAEPASAEAHWSLGEALAHASRSERLYPGEFFGSGTLPGGSGIELGRLLKAGDVIELGIEGIGSVSNRIVDRTQAP